MKTQIFITDSRIDQETTSSPLSIKKKTERHDKKCSADCSILSSLDTKQSVHEWTMERVNHAISRMIPPLAVKPSDTFRVCQPVCVCLSDLLKVF